jgi:hypothetical protein
MSKTPEEMDAAAKQAAAELESLRAENPQAVALIVDWWKRHYLAAGHKRLARVLIGRGAARSRDD